MRLDEKIVRLGLTSSRSQAANYIKLGYVMVNDAVIKKPSYFINDYHTVRLNNEIIYINRGALKLASIAEKFKLDFTDKIILDIGSSTGGFTDYCLKNGAKKIIAVDVGSFQLHPSLVGNPKIELYEKTDIRNFITKEIFDYILIDVSFISISHILDKVYSLASKNTIICLLVKPQFETSKNDLNAFGVVKNDHIRRDILKKIENNFFKNFLILNKSDSMIFGRKGNRERFYLLKKI